MTKINFDEIETINVNCIISLGSSCRGAETLKRNHKQNVLNPFNWLGKYSLDNVISLLKNKGKGFFEDYSFSPKDNTETTLAIIDNNTGIRSKHDFKKNLPNDLNYMMFRQKYDKKFKILDKILKDAEYICIITYRQMTIEEIESFIKKFSELYNFKHLYYINICDDKNEKFIKHKKNNFTLFQYFFNDEHINGRDRVVNPDFWKGNIEYWDKIVSKINLNKDFYKKYIIEISSEQKNRNTIELLRKKLQNN